MDINQNEEWLSLSAAAQMLGVHPSTVRSWANKGLLPSKRTRGGHRRFRRRDIELWTQTSQPADLLQSEKAIATLMRHIRFHIAEADLEKETWYAKMDEKARLAYRKSGKAMIKGLMTWLASQAEEAEPEAHAFGYEYASRAHRYNLRLSEAIQAFLFFRNTYFNSLYHLLSETKIIFSPQHHLLLQRATQFTDQILTNLIETYLLMEN